MKKELIELMRLFIEGHEQIMSFDFAKYSDDFDRWKREIELLKYGISILNEETVSEANLKIELLLDYVSLLREELNETSELCHIHGWQSTRIEQGEQLREKLNEVGIQF